MDAEEAEAMPDEDLTQWDTAQDEVDDNLLSQDAPFLAPTTGAAALAVTRNTLQTVNTLEPSLAEVDVDDEMQDPKLPEESSDHPIELDTLIQQLQSSAPATNFAPKTRIHDTRVEEGFTAVGTIMDHADSIVVAIEDTEDDAVAEEAVDTLMDKKKRRDLSRDPPLTPPSDARLDDRPAFKSRRRIPPSDGVEASGGATGDQTPLVILSLGTATPSGDDAVADDTPTRLNSQRSANQPFGQSTDQPIDQSANQPTGKLTNQRSAIQPIGQSANQRSRKAAAAATAKAKMAKLAPLDPQMSGPSERGRKRGAGAAVKGFAQAWACGACTFHNPGECADPGECPV
jgi:hypothetical protein